MLDVCQLVSYAISFGDEFGSTILQDEFAFGVQLAADIGVQSADSPGQSGMAPLKFAALDFEMLALVGRRIGGTGDGEGDYVSAQRLAEECLALCRQRNNPGETAWPLTCLREIATRRGDFAGARAYLNEALTLGRKTASYWRIVIVRAGLADLAVAEGKPGEALRLYRETLPILLQRGILAHPQGSLRLACLASAVGKHEVAATLLGACSAAVENGIEVLLPITQADFDGASAAAKAVLDPEALETAWATGRSLSPQAAVTWGLQAIHASEVSSQ